MVTFTSTPSYEAEASLSSQVRSTIDNRETSSKLLRVFTDDSGTKPLSIWTLEDQYK